MPSLPKKKSVKFFHTAPPAKSVAVAGSFNQWSITAHPMKKGAKGVWSCSVKIAPGRYEYRFVVDGSQWVDDPTCTERCPNNIEGRNCIMHVK